MRQRIMLSLVSLGLIFTTMLAVAPAANAATTAKSDVSISQPTYGRCGANVLGRLTGWGLWGEFVADFFMYQTWPSGFGCNKVWSW